MRKTLTAMTLGAATAAVAVPALAEYPTRPIQMYVPYGPGGATDISGRALANALADIVPRSLVVSNRTGAGGATGSVAVRDADPDGYTLLFARVGSHTVNPAMNPNLPYTIDEFTFIGMYEINPVACVVNSDSGIETIEEFVDFVKETPGGATFSSAGVGTMPHFASLMVLDAFGVEDLADTVIHIPTEGDGQALTAVLQGTADIFCGSSSPALPFIESGQMTPLLVTSSERLDGFDAPTVEEVGKPELLALVGWTAIAGPAGLSDEVVEKWGAWLEEGTQNPEFNRLLTSGGSIVQYMSPEDTVQFVEDAYDVFRALVVELDLEID